MVLPSGKVVSCLPWRLVSGELFPIALKSLKAVIEGRIAELDSAFSKARIVHFTKNCSFFYIIREVTVDEKNHLMRRVRKSIDKGLVFSVRRAWVAVTKTSRGMKYGYKETSGELDGCSIGGSWGVKLRYSDNVAILASRRKFSSKVMFVVRNKFILMMKDNYKFDDDTFIGSFAWTRLSKKLSPIARDEVKHIIDDENKELEEIVSKSRVLVNSKVDREITNEEKGVVLKKIGRLVNRELRSTFSKAWVEVLHSLEKDCVSVRSSVRSTNEVCAGNKYSSNINVASAMCLDSEDTGNILGSGDRDGGLGVDLYYEDDMAISSIRRKFLSKVGKCVSDKFIKMIKEGKKFGDGMVVHRSSWSRVSKNMLPIVRKEIKPIIDDERVKINDVLLKSRVVVYSPGCAFATRSLRLDEVSNVLNIIMKHVYRRSMVLSRKEWGRVIKFLGKDSCNFSEVEVSKMAELDDDNHSSVCLLDLAEVDIAELDNIRLEFIGNLGAAADETFSSLLLNVGSQDLSSALVNVSSDIVKRSDSLFKEGGFFDRVELLLSSAKLIKYSENSRSLTADERSSVFKLFMDSVASDRDYLLRKRTVELMNAVFPKLESKGRSSVDSMI
ncbi:MULTISPECIES: hypothetical protein [Candidatus Ichthyocystis]|uniref:hypothetical protein n=1 Tax=Candidatus Ichthyocystis TaxID=2929841 RepID=UPI001112A4BB|nr:MULTISPECIES: hypothetical protein [Ichthyocystis]